MKNIVCPSCKKEVMIHGVTYGLPIDVSKDGQLNSGIVKVILIQCGECGVILGGFKKEKLA